MSGASPRPSAGPPTPRPSSSAPAIWTGSATSSPQVRRPRGDRRRGREHVAVAGGGAGAPRRGRARRARAVRLPGKPTLYADYENITTLVGALRDGRDPVAVGSGTLNDIVKRAAHELERPYLCVATAASMDGYTAFGAAITKEGYKQTMTCPAPRAVVADPTC